MSDRRTLAILGTSGAGKTTWLAALTDVLLRGLPSRVAFAEWPTDTTKLFRAAERLQEGQFPLHTSEEQRSVLELPLRVVAGDHAGETVSLAVSDYDGELIERLFRERTHGWSDEWQRRARADAFAVLLRPDATRAIRALRAPPGARREGAPEDPLRQRSPLELFGDPLPSRSLPPTGAASPDDPRYVPTSLAVIELLQWIRHVRGLRPGAPPPPGSLRLAILLTAWDQAPAACHRAGPERSLAEEHPLLRDYLRSNFAAGDVRVFSVTATGGDLADASFRERYLGADVPLSQVGWMQGAALRSSADLSLPLCWALLGDRELAAE